MPGPKNFKVGTFLALVPRQFQGLGTRAVGQGSSRCGPGNSHRYLGPSVGRKQEGIPGPQTGMLASCAGDWVWGLINMHESQVGREVGSPGSMHTRVMSVHPVGRQSFRPASCSAGCLGWGSHGFTRLADVDCSGNMV